MAYEFTEPQKQWLENLRSGRFRQTHGCMARQFSDDERRHCCLGVACETAAEAGVKVNVEVGIDGTVRYDSYGQSSFLPHAVAKYIGTDSMRLMKLAKMNDMGDTFQEIADEIEQNASYYFGREGYREDMI